MKACLGSQPCLGTVAVLCSGMFYHHRLLHLLQGGQRVLQGTRAVWCWLQQHNLGLLHSAGHSMGQHFVAEAAGRGVGDPLPCTPGLVHISAPHIPRPFCSVCVNCFSCWTIMLLASLERCRSALQLYLTVEVLTSEWHHPQRKLCTLLCPCADGRQPRPHPWSLLRPGVRTHLPACVHHAQPLLPWEWAGSSRQPCVPVHPVSTGPVAAGLVLLAWGFLVLGSLLFDCCM